ncbi:MAG: hypothetical protein PHS54_05780 [Clostridia bacterium]|nr:hypothetical protein [Clostridia bacterium]
MLTKWIFESKISSSYSFNVIEVSEKNKIDDEILDYLSEKTLEAYRDVSFLKREFRDKDPQRLIEYIEKYVFPNSEEEISDGERTIRKNVRQGDLGETVSIDLIKSFRNLVVPIYKLRWKFNNNRSVFCTDILAHNKGKKISELKYYEVKTRQYFAKNICVDAYKSLCCDIPKESIADFLARYYNDIASTAEINGKLEMAEKYYSLADEYMDIVKNPNDYHHTFEIILIAEKSQYQKQIKTILLELENEKPPLPMQITFFLVEDLKSLAELVYKKALEKALIKVYA